MERTRLAQQTYVVGAGKGGVGKSTVAVNLAAALANRGRSVGILDADVYGPSIPIMMGLRRLSPQVARRSDGSECVVPFSKFGVRALSIGFFMEEARSVIWRGPILHSTLERMVKEVDWGELDDLIIDLPPGTGDVQISLSQLLHIDGAILVCTPQEVAMLDAIKAANAFSHLEIPLVGVVENMAGFRPPGSDETFHIFGQGKAEELALRFNTQVLASLPIDPDLRIGADEGRPPAYYSSQNGIGKHFADLAENLCMREQALASNPFA
ncbi:MAG: Mrp/NBP35 family ATP-binding protein [Chlamydiia bacterium]|nr:Mrp/NBP35 family ATP-binding protein [Chlamydiia bacterium]